MLALAAWTMLGFVVWRLRVNNFPRYLAPAMALRLVVIVQLALFYTFLWVRHSGWWWVPSFPPGFYINYIRGMWWTVLALYTAWLISGALLNNRKG
jgi:hypothetical protein